MRLSICVFAAIATLSLAPFAQPVAAATITVTTTADDGAGSLRQALRNAKASAGADTIVFDLPGPGPHIIALARYEVAIDSDVTLLNDRPGDEAIAIEGGGDGSSGLLYNVFNVIGGNHATLAGLTVRKGSRSNITSSGGFLTLRNCTVSDNNNGSFGGGIEYSGVELTLVNCLFTRNRAGSGGAIRYSSVAGEESVMTAINCMFADNSATDSFDGRIGGGAIYAGTTGTLVLTDCTFANNSAANGGGAIFNDGPQANANIRARNCTFLTNRARTGGAIYNNSEAGARGVLDFENCTFSANYAENGGGAIHTYKLSDGGTAYTRLNSCTFVGNANLVGSSLTVGGTISSRIPVRMSNNIFRRGSYTGGQFSGLTESLGHNLSDDGAEGDRGTLPGGRLNGPGDIRNTDPQLAPLANNGGASSTHALLATSPAIDAGDDAQNPANDQRGYARVGRSDIGSYEFGGSATGSEPSPTPTPTIPDGVLKVSNVADSGEGSLRQAILNANSRSGDDVIEFEIPGAGPHQISLETELPQLSTSVRILNDKPGRAQITVVRGPSASPFGIFFVTEGSVVEIAGLTLAGGRRATQGRNRGGAIYNDRSTLTLRDCTIYENSAVAGGAIYNSAFGFSGAAADTNLTLINSTIANCSTFGTPTEIDQGGGAIYNEGSSGKTATTNLVNSRVTMNRAVNGAGILNRGGDGIAVFRVSGSTLDRNTTSGVAQYDGMGGAIDNQDGAVYITNSTLSGNIAQTGGAIATYGFATVTLTNSTITANGATYRFALFGGSGGVRNNGVMGALGNNGNSAVIVRNTIIAGNSAVTGAADAAGPFLSEGYNLLGIDTGSTGFVSGTRSDRVGTASAPLDTKLAPLQQNGGTQPTHALLDGSPAIDGGTATGAPALDQRGYARVGVTDIGAFEYGGPVPKRLANLATRLRSEAGDDVLIGGFIVSGSGPKRVLLRAIGPSLGLPGRLENPTVELFNSAGESIAANDDWKTAANSQEIVESTIPPSDELEAAILTTLQPGSYTAVLRGSNGSTGIAVAELYDLDQAGDSRLSNISTRGIVGKGDDVMIGGFIVSGTSPQRVIVRAIGPSLPIATRLANPKLELYDQNGVLLQGNDDWRTSQEAEIIATSIAPTHDSESAIIRTLPPAPYTAIVRGVNDGTGVALVEVYALN